MSRWVIELEDPCWGKSLYAQRWFETPEAAACYAQALIELPEIWVSQEGALCRLLESSDPEQVEFKIICRD